MEHSTRMRIERDRRRLCANRFRAIDNGSHYFLMTEMQSIENAQRQNRRAKDIRVLSAVKNFHFQCY